IRARFKEMKQRREDIVNLVKILSSFDASYELRIEVTSYLQLERDKSKFLIYGIEILLLLETIFIFFTMTTPSFNPSLRITLWNFPVFMVFVFFILFVYTSFALMQYVDDLNQFEDTFSDGLMARIQYLYRNNRVAPSGKDTPPLPH